MPRSYSRIVLHTVFSTKYRQPLISPELEDGLYGVMGNELKKHGCDVIRIGGGFDHVHIIHTLPRTLTLATVIQEVKSRSSRWMNNRLPAEISFKWQIGYSSHSADYRKLNGLICYVENQKAHHYGTENEILVSFEQEYSKLLRAYGFDFDPALEFPRCA